MSSAPLGPASKPQFVFKVSSSPRQKLKAFSQLETAYVQTHPAQWAQHYGVPEQRPTQSKRPREASSRSPAWTFKALLFPPRRCGVSPTAQVSRHPSKAGGTVSFPEELYTENTRLNPPHHLKRGGGCTVQQMPFLGTQHRRKSPSQVSFDGSRHVEVFPDAENRLSWRLFLVILNFMLK